MVCCVLTSQGKFFPSRCRLNDAQPLPILGWRGSLLGPCLGPPWDPLVGHRSVVLRRFDPLHDGLCISNIYTQFHPRRIPQKPTTKHYDTLVQLRLICEHLGRFTSKLFKLLKLILTLLLTILGLYNLMTHVLGSSFT